MHNAELHRHLSPSQYGGRKGSNIEKPGIPTDYSLWTIHREELPLSTTSCTLNWTGTDGWTTKVDMHSEYST
eukprot:8567428-Ditylum_brightwellii.AAC.1